MPRGRWFRMYGDEQPSELPVSSLPLGIDEQTKYASQSYSFTDGDRLVLYTDGIVEVHDRRGTLLGMEHMEACLAKLPSSLCADKQLEALLSLLEAGNEPHYEDDRTLVMVVRDDKNKGQPIGPPPHANLHKPDSYEDKDTVYSSDQ